MRGISLKRKERKRRRQAPNTWTLWIIVAVAALTYMAFWLIGYDTPYAENPTFTAPLLTDAVMGLAYALIILTIVATGISVANSIRTNKRHDRQGAGGDHRLARLRRHTTLIVATALPLCLVITFVAGSDAPLTVNGESYDDALWLKVADMFIGTAVALTVVAAAAVMCSMLGLGRIIGKKGSRQ